MLPWWIISHDIIIEIPEDVGWGLRSVGYDTGQVDGGAPVHMEIRRALDPHMRYWKICWFVVRILKYSFSFYFTTYYVKCYGVGLRGLCWNLTLIYTSISFLYKNFKSCIFGFKVVIEFATHLYIFNQQNPLILWIMFCRKSLIWCKSLLPGC